MIIIPWSGSPPKFNQLFTGPLPTFPENFMQIRLKVFFCAKSLTDSQTNKQTNNKHNCVLSNAGLSNALTKTGICTSLKSGFYFRFHSPSNTKLALPNCICTWDLVLICWKICSPEPENCRSQNPLTSKSSKLLPVCVTIGVDATTFLSRLQNLVKIGKELWT